jgi:hypothetical protein
VYSWNSVICVSTRLGCSSTQLKRLVEGRERIARDAATQVEPVREAGVADQHDRSGAAELDRAPSRSANAASKPARFRAMGVELRGARLRHDAHVTAGDLVPVVERLAPDGRPRAREQPDRRGRDGGREPARAQLYSSGSVR